MAYIGSRVKRKEDLRLLRGIGKYVGDIHRVDMVHAVILRSSRAHARLVNIDASAAMALPGVIGVLTGKDMPGVKTIPMRTGKVPGLERSQQTPIVTTKARYVGKGSRRRRHHRRRRSDRERCIQGAGSGSETAAAQAWLHPGAHGPG